MMRFIIFRVGLSCSLALLTFAVASGQEFFDSSFLAPTQDGNGGGEIDAAEAPIEQTLRLATDPKLAEDIEIMGWLLHSAVKGLYGNARRSAETGYGSGAGRAMPGMSGMDEMGEYEYGGMMGSAVNSLAQMGLSRLRKLSDRQTERVRGPLGLYLAGHGVVFQMEAPPVRQPLIKSAEGQAKQVCPFTSRSVWERTRMRLRGDLTQANCMKCHSAARGKALPGAAGQFSDMEDSEADDDTRNHTATLIARGYLAFGVSETSRMRDSSEPTKDDLVSRLLRVFSENGHNLAELSAAERLTIAITFRKVTDLRARQQRGLLFSKGMFGGTMQGPATRSGSARSDSDVGGNENVAVEQFASESFVFGGQVGNSALAAAGNDELSGDLLMRQENYVKAITPYEKAIRQRFGKAPYAPFVFPADLKVRQPRQRVLFEKLGRALVGAGKYDKARQLLDNLTRAGEFAKLNSSDKPAEARELQPPARLIVSATKSQLDDVAAGKISQEQFRKQVIVRYVDIAGSASKQQSEASGIKGFLGFRALESKMKAASR